MISRRHFLRAASVTLALPVLESLHGTARAKGPAAPPKRFAFIYTPNGYNQTAFLPKATGPEWEITPTLQPLARHREHLALFTGLDRQFVGGTGVHAQCGSCWLTSSAPQETPAGAATAEPECWSARFGVAFIASERSKWLQ